MAGFHLPDDPYFPNQGNVCWLDAKPEEEEPVIPLDDDFAEKFSDDSYTEPEVNNLPPVAPAPNPNPHPAFQGLTPPWVESLETWSKEQHQPIPFNGYRSFYNLSERGSTDRVLSIMVRRVARNEIQGRTALNRIMEVVADARIHIVRTIHLEDARERSIRDNEGLQQELAATQAEAIELRIRQRVYERQLLDMEHQLASLRVHPRGTHRRLKML